MTRILLIDNYDSFVYNIVHLVKRATGIDVDLCFNNQVPFEKLNEYSHIILSPGPGIPSEAGDLLKVIERCSPTHSILGICLGHQAIAQHYGAKLINLSHPLHGHKSVIASLGSPDPLLSGLFSNKGERVEVGLYHSWAVSGDDFPEELTVGSVNEEGIIMSLFHKSLPIFGVQFHPESVITTSGDIIIRNWINHDRL